MYCSLCSAGPIQQDFEKQGIPYYPRLGCDFVFSKPANNANLPNEIDDYKPAYFRYFAESEEDERNRTARSVGLGDSVRLTASACSTIGAEARSLFVFSGDLMWKRLNSSLQSLYFQSICQIIPSSPTRHSRNMPRIPTSLNLMILLLWM